MISLILHSIWSLMPSNLSSRSQQLKLKKVFLYDGRKPMVNHFTINRVWENLGHTLSWPQPSSNYCSTKGSITSRNPRTCKSTHFLRRNATFWLKTKYCLFPHTRATQSSNLFVKATELLKEQFDKLRCHDCCAYAVSTGAHHQEKELPFRQGKELAVRLLFLRMEGTSTF